MEVSDDDCNQFDEMEWIERHTHELILRKYRVNTKRLIREYQAKIKQQNQDIETLKKEVKRQQFIIDTFTNESTEHLDNSTTQQKTSDDCMIVEHFYPKYESDQEQDVVLERGIDTMTYINCNDHVVTNQLNKVKRKSLSSPCKSNQSNGFYRLENVPKKSSLVSIHIQPNIHDTDDVYVCDECNKIMSSRRVLVKHKRMVHCLQKKFVCDHCSKAFCVRDGLKRHLRIHTGEKPFICRGCQKGFNQSGNMRIHEKTCKKYLKLNGRIAG